MIEKNNIFYKNNLKLTKNNTFDPVFSKRIFLYYRSLPIFKKWLDFHKSWLFFKENILYNSTVFNFVYKFSVAEIVKRTF